MHDRPDVAELLEAVREFLANEVAPAMSDQRLKFRALIAANVLSVAERQVLAGDDDHDRALEQVSALLDERQAAPSDHVKEQPPLDAQLRALCASIRAGERDDPTHWQATFDFALWHVRSKLRISNPRYRNNLETPNAAPSARLTGQSGGHENARGTT